MRIIRPFVYLREQQTREFAIQNNLPIISDNCPACFESPKERARIKTLLAEQEHETPALFSKLLKAMTPLLRDSETASNAEPHGEQGHQPGRDQQQQQSQQRRDTRATPTKPSEDDNDFELGTACSVPGGACPRLPSRKVTRPLSSFREVSV